jgi:hypothetical protein
LLLFAVAVTVAAVAVAVAVVVVAAVSAITNALKVAEASAAELEVGCRQGKVEVAVQVSSALGDVGFPVFGSPKPRSTADDQQA